MKALVQRVVESKCSGGQLTTRTPWNQFSVLCCVPSYRLKSQLMHLMHASCVTGSALRSLIENGIDAAFSLGYFQAFLDHLYYLIHSKYYVKRSVEMHYLENNDKKKRSLSYKWDTRSTTFKHLVVGREILKHWAAWAGCLHTTTHRSPSTAQHTAKWSLTLWNSLQFSLQDFKGKTNRLWGRTGSNVPVSQNLHFCLWALNT